MEATDEATQDQEVSKHISQSWSGYTWSIVKGLGQGTMAVINYIGEKLAYGLGITTPDWQYAIDIYEDMEREEREEKEAEERALREQRLEALRRLSEMETAKSPKD